MTAQLNNFDIVLFGATGDLAMRKLLPCLYQAHAAGLLHPEGRILFVKGRGVTLKGKLMRPAGCEIITEYNLGSNSALLVEMHGAWCIFYCG